MKYYSMVGTTEMVVDASSRPVCPAGHIEMASRRPGPDYVAQADGSWASSRTAHDIVWSAVKALRSEKEVGGIRVEHEGETIWFDSDLESRSKLATLFADEALPDGLAWKTMDNERVLLTPGLLSAMRLAMLATDDAMLAAAEAHREAMGALDDPGSYDFSTGWPETYAEWQAGQAAESMQAHEAAAAASGATLAVLAADQALPVIEAALPAAQPVAAGSETGAAGVAADVATDMAPMSNEMIVQLLGALQQHFMGVADKGN